MDIGRTSDFTAVVTIAQGGVLPNIQAVLLPKKTSTGVLLKVRNFK